MRMLLSVRSQLRSCLVTDSLRAQRRHAASTSFSSAVHSFKSGATSATPFAKSGGGGEGSVLGWQPSPKLMRNPVFRFLFHNAIPIATYQLVLEFGLTAIFGLLIYNKRVTPEGVVQTLKDWHYPFLSWISLEDCTYTEEISVGPRTLKPEKLTAGHTAHNIATGLLPLQGLVLICTYPLVMRGYRAAKGMTKAGKAATAAAAAAAERSAQAAAREAAIAKKKAAVAAAKNPSGQVKRRPSYIRPTTSHK